MYVRLGFSVAVHVDPQILIIDEVIAVGDEEFQRRCFDHLYKLRNQGVTIVMVTHSLSLVQTMCDRAAWLDHGKLMADGPAAEVVHQYIAKVNEHEAERLEEEAAEARRGRGNGAASRSARSPMTLERFEFLDASGHDVTTTTPLEPLTVRMHFICSQPGGAPLFCFAVKNEHGVLLANPGMRRRTAQRDLRGDGHVDYEIPRLSLAPGQYTLHLRASTTATG